MPNLPSIPSLPVSIPKILLGIFLFVLALAIGIAGGSVAFKIKNPNSPIQLTKQESQEATPLPTPPIVGATSPSPSSQIPSDWQTYKNEILGFEFRYPPDATIEETDLRGQEITDAFITPAEYTYKIKVNFGEGEFLSVASSVDVYDQYKPISPKATAEAILDASNATLGLSDTTLGGKSAYKVSSQENPLLLFFVLSFGKSNETSEISISTIADKSREDTINKIVSSFKFL